MNLDLNVLAKPSATKTSHSYKVIGVEKSDTGTIKSMQCDRGDKTTVFTVKRFQELVASGKITVISATEFTLAVDPNFVPGNNFVPVDLG
jgi:hypothetical protein